MATIDGPNKVLTLNDPGLEPVQNAIRVYSEWKEWVRVSDNSKFLRAFDDSIGGNLTNPPEKISAYVFVRNDLGWRIRPFEANGDTLLEGDLFPFDPGLPLFIPTIGTYNTSIRQLVSSKALAVETGVSGLTAAESQQLNEVHGQIGRYLWIDATAGSNGSGYQQSPFNDLTSLVTESSTSGIKFIVVLGDLTLDQNMIGYNFEGRSIPQINFAGFNVNGSEFTSCALTGAMQGEVRVATGCDLVSVTGLRGTFNECSVAGINALDDGARVIFRKGFSSTLITPSFDFTGLATLGTELIVKDFSGNVEVNNITAANISASIELNGGTLTIDSTCTDGTVDVIGVGRLVDNSGAGCTVNTLAFMNADDTTNLRKLMTNRFETDPVTGTLTVYDDDDTTILYQGNIWENVLATQIYRGRGSERRDKLDLYP